jgi:hypothetical protein
MEESHDEVIGSQNGGRSQQRVDADPLVPHDAVRAISGHFPLVRTLAESRRGVAMFRCPGGRLRSAFTFAHSVNPHVDTL